MEKFRNLSLLFIFSAYGCEGNQSALNATGSSAKIISDMFWWMLIGAALIWIIFISLGFYAIKHKSEADESRRKSLFVIGGGGVFPTVILSFLLYFSLTPLPKLLEPAPSGSLRLEVSGAQWWWRVRYPLENGNFVELANEIRLPVGEPVEIKLTSEDVIHSFWVPSLAGKMDMIPGNVTKLSFTPEKVGLFKGACAEYCGASHALMQLDVVVMKKEAFQEWLDWQKRPALEAKTAMAVKGKVSFKQNGCVACHTVRGVESRGVIGPDLTHVGSRLRLGAGVMINSIPSYHQWISRVEEIKPGVKMPSFNMISNEDIKAISVWLEGLK